MLNWFRRKSEPKLRLTFEYEPGRPIQCICDWPTGQTEEANKLIVRDFSQMLAAVGMGKLLSAAQQGIALAGERLGTPVIARAILFDAAEMLAVASGNRRSGGPVVPATECFAVRNVRRNEE